jgi:hypothetical protein
MRKGTILFLLIAVTLNVAHGQQLADSTVFRNIYNHSLTNGKAYSWLHHLCKGIGGRLAGSPEAEKAIDYTYRVMDSIVPGNVHKQNVMVVNWKRGNKESCYSTQKNGTVTEYRICALGNSVGTPSGGLKAKVIEVKDFDELSKLSADEVKGKIVFFNEPMDQTYINTFDAYSHCGKIRWSGPGAAAPLGAVATINRSLTHIIDDNPHTGSISYKDSIPKIPGAAISTIGADRLSKDLEADPELELFLEMNCKMLDDIPSSNVIGEIRGSEFPDEIIVVGGHLDSWDNGEGAHDDGAGCVQSIEVLNIFRELGIVPKRTIRAVMFINEENGIRGGNTYAEEAKNAGTKHIAAIESDAGGFSPRGFFLDGDSVLVEYVKQWKDLFEPYLVHDFSRKGSGADIYKLKEQGAVVMGLSPDSQRYFDYHHAETDVFENVNRRELQLGAATMAAMAYLLSEYGIPAQPEN